MNNRIKKVIAWRLLSTMVALFVTYAFLGHISKTIEMVAFLTLAMTVIHYYFEKWWEMTIKE